MAKMIFFDLRDDRVRPFEYAFQANGVNAPDDEIWDKLFDGRLNIADTVEKGGRFCLG